MTVSFFTKRRNERALKVCRDLGLDPSEVYDIEQVSERRVQVSFLSPLDPSKRWQKLYDYDWPRP